MTLGKSLKFLNAEMNNHKIIGGLNYLGDENTQRVHDIGSTQYILLIIILVIVFIGISLN